MKPTAKRLLVRHLLAMPGVFLGLSVALTISAARDTQHPVTAAVVVAVIGLAITVWSFAVAALIIDHESGKVSIGREYEMTKSAGTHE